MCTSGPPRSVIFDLDGTLVQTRIASWEVFREVNSEFSLGLTGPQDFYTLFENIFFESLRSLCRDETESAQVEHSFLCRLEANYSPTLIPGMADVIRALASHSTLAVLSSNTTSVLRRVLLDNNLAYCFAHVFGGDVEPDKAQGIRRFLADASDGCGRRCEVSYDEAQKTRTENDDGTTVLITDTVGDVHAAVTSGIRTMGVSWGMHSEEELTRAGAEFVAIWPQELLSKLISSSPVAKYGCSLEAQQEVTSTSEQLAYTATLRRRRRTQEARRLSPQQPATPYEATPVSTPTASTGQSTSPAGMPISGPLLAAVCRIIK